jgi:hypothetical protein
MPVPFEIQDNLVYVGQVANDGTGDDLRTAFDKINNNFLYLGNRLGTDPSGANVGATGESVFKEVVDFQYRFRKIGADGNLRVRLVGDVVTLDFRPNSAVDFYGNNITNAGSVTATSFTGPLTGNVTGTVTGNAGSVTNGVYTNGNQTIDGFKTFTQPITGLLSGNVTGLIRSPNETDYVDVSDLERRINTFDYGVINPVGLNSFKDPIRYYLYVVGTDMGTFNNPSEFGIDAGTI